MEQRVYSNRMLSLLPAAYMAHLIDGRCFWIGTATFATGYLGIFHSIRGTVRRRSPRPSR